MNLIVGQPTNSFYAKQPTLVKSKYHKKRIEAMNSARIIPPRGTLRVNATAEAKQPKEAKPIKLSIVIIPPPEIQDALLTFSRVLERYSFPVRPKVDLCIQVQYLGSMEQEVGKGLLRSIKYRPFEVGLSGFSYATPEELKLVYAQVGEGAEDVQKIRLQLFAELRRREITPVLEIETKTRIILGTLYGKQHLVTAPDRAFITNLVRQLSQRPLGRFTVSKIVLARSSRSMEMGSIIARHRLTPDAKPDSKISSSIISATS